MPREGTGAMLVHGTVRRRTYDRSCTHRNDKEMTMKLRVGLDEILPSKEAARALPQVIDRLESGDAEHVVITRRNKPRAVLVTIERYEQLLSGGAAAA